MCTFNGARFLNGQLQSIASQDRPPDELVVCDDGSSDGSHEIVIEFARHARFPVRFLINERQLGSTQNFQKAISLCQCSLVVLADQDDVWYKNKLARLEGAFHRSTDVVCAFSDADLIDDNSQALDRRLWASFSFDEAKQHQFATGDALSVLIKHPVITGATMAFHREFFEQFSPIPAGQIHDRWISFLLAARGQIEPIAEPLMQYRSHEGQQVGPGPGFLTLPGRIARANRTGPALWLEEIEQFQLLYEVLDGHGGDFPNAESAKKKLLGKVSHLGRRARLPRARIARIPDVLRETLNGGYWLYSAGWKSVAKDLTISSCPTQIHPV
jgi:glycosyltransferase involved in cell wall biosynthesis